MPNDSDLSCQSGLDLPELEPPSVVELELEPDDDDGPESLPEWETSNKLSDSASLSTDSGSEGTSASETSVFRPLVPLSLRLPPNCAPVWFSEILLPQHKDHIRPMLHKVHKVYGAHMEQHVHSIWHAPKVPKILLPSARHLEEGRGTAILELPRLENCISRLCPSPLGAPPPPPPHPNRVKNT